MPDKGNLVASRPRSFPPSLSTQLATSAFPTHRIIGLGDGVFAIALTLLVLELRVPAAKALDAAGRHQELLHALPGIATSLLWYVVTGLSIGRYWLTHSRLLHLPHQPNGRFANLNVLLFLVVSLLPFAASVLTRYSSDGIAVALYGSVQALINGILLLLLRTVEEAAPDGFEMKRTLRSEALTGLLVFSLIAVLAPWWMTSTVLLLLFPLSRRFFLPVLHRLHLHR